jgi:hypothetical protein
MFFDIDFLECFTPQLCAPYGSLKRNLACLYDPSFDYFSEIDFYILCFKL